MNYQRLSSDKLLRILTYQPTTVNKKVNKNGKNLTFLVFGHPELVGGSLIHFFCHEDAKARRIVERVKRRRRRMGRFSAARRPL